MIFLTIEIFLIVSLHINHDMYTHSSTLLTMFMVLSNTFTEL